MDIFSIGLLVKKARKKSGLSQKSVAAASNVSRVTIVNLENGHAGDIGVVKLSSIAEVIDLPIFGGSKTKDYSMVVLGNINTSYKNYMDLNALEEVMLTGVVGEKFIAQVVHLIDETPTAIIAGAVKQVANKHNFKAKNIWSNLSSIAREIKSPNKFWSSIE